VADRRIKVTGHLEEKRGIYQIVLNWKENGKRCRKGFSTRLPIKSNKKKAEAMLRKACDEQEEFLAQRGDVSPKSTMLFADLIEQWFEDVKNNWKPTTRGVYEMQVKRTIIPYFRKTGVRLCDLTTEDIKAFFEKELCDVKATTAHKYYNNLSCALNYAMEEERSLIDINPIKKVKRPKPKAEERFSAKFLKQSEAIRLFEAIKGHKLELGVILAAYYGLRRGEVVGLRWESIDFERNTITIDHTVVVAQDNGKKKIIASDTTKNKSSYRTLPLVPVFRAKLLALQEEQNYYRKLCGKSYNKKESQYIYIDVMGNRIRPDYLTQEFPEWMIKNGFRRMRFHDLRHSCASLLLASGVSLKQIQDWLGHSSFKITADTYAHLEYESKIAAANAMTWVNATSLGSSFTE
jgi:integrase